MVVAMPSCGPHGARPWSGRHRLREHALTIQPQKEGEGRRRGQRGLTAPGACVSSRTGLLKGFCRKVAIFEDKDSFLFLRIRTQGSLSGRLMPKGLAANGYFLQSGRRRATPIQSAKGLSRGDPPDENGMSYSPPSPERLAPFPWRALVLRLSSKRTSRWDKLFESSTKK